MATSAPTASEHEEEMEQALAGNPRQRRPGEGEDETGPSLKLRSTLARIEEERAFYADLLSLGSSDDLERLVEEALGIIVRLTRARQGYLELVDPGAPGECCWSIGHGCPEQEIEQIRRKISRGIIAEAMAGGSSIATTSALLDPRFERRDSVRIGCIEAVLCAPIGEEAPIGVVYLQGRSAPGGWDQRDIDNSEIFARQLFLVADRLLVHRRSRDHSDATRELRREYRLESIVGRSAALAAVLRDAMLAAPTDVSILITGASGTGKNLVARCIHANSSRASEPFVELSCATIPEALAESELFGAVRGAHSTATAAVEGKVAAAGDGTLFLDEIAELPLATQAKLLQFLQSREYYPLGSTQPRRSGARIIAATNVDLAARVAEGRFREDLLFRINIFRLHMPSLGERPEDVPELAAALCARVCEQNGLPPLTLSLAARTALRTVQLPGNVRQLFNLLSAAAIRAAGSGASMIQPVHVFPAAEQMSAAAGWSFAEATRDFQRDLLVHALESSGWNVASTARRLELARSHVYNLIKAFGLERS